MTTDRNPTNDRLDAFAGAVTAAFTYGAPDCTLRIMDTAAYLFAAITEVGLRPALTTAQDLAAWELFTAYVGDAERRAAGDWRKTVTTYRMQLAAITEQGRRAAHCGGSRPHHTAGPCGDDCLFA